MENSKNTGKEEKKKKRYEDPKAETKEKNALNGWSEKQKANKGRRPIALRKKKARLQRGKNTQMNLLQVRENKERANVRAIHNPDAYYRAPHSWHESDTRVLDMAFLGLTVPNIGGFFLSLHSSPSHCQEH